MTHKLTPYGFILLLAMAFVANETHAAVSSKQTIVLATAPALTQSYIWYDGDRERTVWLDPALLMEFNSSDGAQSPLRKLLPGAKLHSTVGKNSRIWNLGNGVDPQVALQNLRTRKTIEKYSPVFHESPSSLSHKRALPGNMIVYLKPEWTQKEVDQWIKKNRLQVLQKMSFGPYVYLIHTPEGLDSLKQANQLYQSGEVLAATPEWWEDLRVK